LETEKKEFKIEALTTLLDKEEQRRNRNASKMETQVELYKKNMEFEKKREQLQEQERRKDKENQQKMHKKLEEIEKRVLQAKEALTEKPPNHLEELTKQNRIRLEEEGRTRLEKLTQKLRDEEENYERMKQELIKIKTEKPFISHEENIKSDKIARVKRENELRYQTRKENMMLKLHHNEEILKQRQRKREKDTLELKKINEKKQLRKEVVKETYLKKLDSRRKELSKKLKEDQEKADALAKQKEVILEQKYTNQMIDQMKVHYFKELHYNQKVNNVVGTEEFDKMAQNLKSIPEED